MQLVTTTAELAALCERLARERYVTVDTEFMRDRTYWPKLCLVQLAGEREAAAIDALAPGLDLAPLLELMAEERVLKVFHACRQDLEIFWLLMKGEVPRPIYDTQVAAMVCGFGEEVAYDTLVQKLAKARLDKSFRFTDWSKRPLSEAQVRYALSDVTHLRQIYEQLASRVDAAGRTAWVEDELARIADPAQFEQPPEEAWRRLKLRTRDPRFLAVVQKLAAWRERTARAKDLPRQRVLRDDLLLEIAAHKPRTVEELRGHERISLDRASLAAVVAAVNEGLAVPAADLPQLVEPQELPRGIGPLVDMLRVLLKVCCEQADVAQRMVASTSDLEAIAMDDHAPVPALAGWRRELFGEAALALKHGRIALVVKDRRPAILTLAKTG
ncbi:MAG: ribonuclease D [Geminicoccaceae bacterium]|nr:ribonuclease D [Geminicoccaceae bacterium]MDW8369893.1 ribonuclease D [Geminicoccaceae bacterium]